MRLSLRYRLLLVPLVLLIGTALATAYAAIHAAATADRQIQARIQSIIATLRGPPTFPLTVPVLTQMKNLSGADFLVASGAVARVSTFAEPVEPPSDTRMFRKTVDHPPVEVASREYRWFEVALPASHPNAGSTVYIFYPEDVRQREIGDAMRPVLLLGIGGGLVASVLSFLVARRLVSRIREIEEGTREVAAGQFEPLPMPDADDELRDLVVSVNDMAAKLAAGAETLRQNERLRVLGQVSGGLAHQLRNAAAGARLAVQLAVKAPEDREPLGVALRQLTRMESILRQFLELGRPSERLKVPGDLRDAIDRAVSLVEPQARHSRVMLVWKRPAKEMVRPLDVEQFGHLLENLLTNAMEAGKRVEITLSEDRLEIIDDGAGPAPEIAAKLFEPFASAKPGGIGLGLMVAKQVAEAHGATLTWSRRQEQTIFSIRFSNQP